MKKRSRLVLLKKLGEKRREIDLMDRKLLSLLNRRLRIALEIGKIKKEMGEKIYDPRRETEVIEKLKIKNKGPLKNENLRKIFSRIIGVCRKSQIEMF